MESRKHLVAVIVGGEWLLIPLFLLFATCIYLIKDFFGIYHEKEKSITESANSSNAHNK